MQTIPSSMQDNSAACFDDKLSPTWRHFQPPQRRLAFTAIIRREGAQFSAVVPLLPAVVSCGDTMEEVKANIVDAANLIVASYLGNEGSIPWLVEPSCEDVSAVDDDLYAFSVDV